MNQGTNLGSQIGRWIVLAAVVALLGALLLTIRPVGAQQRPDTETRLTFAENSDAVVKRFQSTDPEGNPIFWTLGGPDAADFTIERGTLKFKNRPNFEVPTDRANDENGNGEVAPATEGQGNNIYKVTLREGAGGEDGDPNPIDGFDHDDVTVDNLTITVTNVNEPGRVFFSSLQPQEGTELTATVTDQDGVGVIGSWQWASSDSMSGPFMDIPERSSDSTYRPVEADLGKYLQVTVQYRDNASDTDDRELSAVSAYPVRKATNTTNDPPKFPDQRTLGRDPDTPTTGTPLYARLSTERFIFENSTPETKVGAPVTAFDDDTDIEVLTYSLRDTLTGDGNSSDGNSDNDPNTPSVRDGHSSSFNIDPATGQITVSASAKFDADVETGELGHADTPYQVTVQATDGDAHRMSIAVNIRVVGVNEAPTIDRVYQTGRIPDSPASYEVGDRVPTEMSHYEADRNNPTSTVIDTDLDTPSATTIEPAIYYATDPEDENITWKLKGPDASQFVIPEDAATEVEDATLAFKKGPDFEKAGDKNTDNVYEVTLVVTDSVGNESEFDVTVKVLDSKDDNQPGKVTISNRQPEVGADLVATLKDPDKDVKGDTWQWYRLTTTGQPPRDRCPGYDASGADIVRGFMASDAFDSGQPWDNWEEIPDATDAKYTPNYDEDSGGRKLTSVDDGFDAFDNTDQWVGGDIDVTVTIADGTITDYSTWVNGKCLRATVTYDDGAKDNTYIGPDDTTTTKVDETLEGSFYGSEFPVKGDDLENDAPRFTVDGNRAADSVDATKYEATRREDRTGNGDFTPPATPTLRIIEAHDATEDVTSEDDGDSDILTYSLSGDDAAAFVIIGTVDTGGAGVYAAADEGVLSFKTDHKLDHDNPRDKNKDNLYEVTIKATDPSGESATVDVTVDITDWNERPEEWGEDTSPSKRVYMENGTLLLATYSAKDPENTVIEYSLVAAEITAAPQNGNVGVVAADFEDEDLFSINPADGTLRFKSPPNYEDPKDEGGNNIHQVTVQAEVQDDPVLPSAATPENPAGPHVLIQKVTVVVTNKNEAPVFPASADTLEITENRDDPRNEPPLADVYLYLLNRGVGKPGADDPVAPYLDVGIPVVAADDDNTSDFAVETTTPPNTTDRIDGLTYTLSGADAAHFHIVPATGQILTLKKLDYEAKNEYKVTVTVTDTGVLSEDGKTPLSDSIAVTINVTNVDEPPVPKVLVIRGEASHSQQENDPDDLSEYEVSAGGGASANPAWTLEGADASSFMLTGSGASRMLKFASAPDYENPKGGADNDSNTYQVTLEVTDPNDSNTVGEFAVTVTVTDVDELGTLSGSTTDSVNEGDTDVGTYTLTAIEDGPRVTWSWEGTDMSDFMLEGRGMSRMLKFSSAPDYENPKGGATNDSNTYMVTVKAEAGGEMDMVEVTVTVTDVDELGTLSGSDTASINEGDTDLGTYTLTGTAADTADWSLDETGTSDFMLEGRGMSRMLKFSSAPDYENPKGGAANDSNTYMVTVMAEAGGEEEMVAVTITVDNVEEAGTVTLNPTRPSVGTPITASLEDSDIVEGTVSWQWAKSMTMDGDFEDITGADSDTYTPAAADAGMYLMATATYTDRLGSDSANMVTETAVSQLAVNGLAEVEHPENVTNVAAYMASGADSVQWSLLGDDAGDFNINSGQLTFRTSPDYEDPADANTDNVYMVTVVATAGTLMASQDVTVTVSNVNEAGTVTLSTMSPAVGSEVTASLTDLDGGITRTSWQWASADAMDGSFEDITGADSASYTPVEGDAGMYLQATASYTDGHGTGKMATSEAVMVNADTVAGYDTDGTPGIQIDELFDAIDDYFDTKINIDELFAVIDAYFE